MEREREKEHIKLGGYGHGKDMEGTKEESGQHTLNEKLKKKGKWEREANGFCAFGFLVPSEVPVAAMGSEG